tara:strand:+ start:196 stop:555 length:360 start_codon:yes stop_codon:yes gene_type:complete
MVDVRDEISTKNELIRLLSSENDRLRDDIKIVESKNEELISELEEMEKELDKAKRRNFGNYNQSLISEAEDYFHHNDKAERVIFLMVADIDIDDDNELIGDIDGFKISDIANKTITQGE